MNPASDPWPALERVLLAYSDGLTHEVDARFQSWAFDPMAPERNEVAGALIARQASLAAGVAQAPAIWNFDLGSVLLRAMEEVHITLAWILKAPEERSKKFIEFGLGQEKLVLEHIKNPPAGTDPPDEDVFSQLSAWLESQRFAWATVVNVAAWADMSFRKMADQAGMGDRYRMVYVPLSCNAHSMWNHIGKYNLRRCNNALHRYHRLPQLSSLRPDFRGLRNVAVLADQTFHLLDEWSGKATWTSAFEILDEGIGSILPPQEED